MAIPDEHRQLFEQILAAGAAGNLAMMEVTINDSGEAATALVIREQQGDGYAAVPFAILDPEIINFVTPPEDVQEIYEQANEEDR